MNFGSTVIFILLGLIHVIFAIGFTQKIYGSNRFGETQKRLNTIMVWIIPFLWFLLIRDMLKPTGVMTKSKRPKHENFPEVMDSGYADNI